MKANSFVKKSLKEKLVDLPSTITNYNEMYKFFGFIYIKKRLFRNLYSQTILPKIKIYVVFYSIGFSQ